MKSFSHAIGRFILLNSVERERERRATKSIVRTPNQYLCSQFPTIHSSNFYVLYFIQQTMHIQVANRLFGQKKDWVNKKSSRLFHTDTISFLFSSSSTINNNQYLWHFKVLCAYWLNTSAMLLYLKFERVKYSLFNGIRYTHWMRELPIASYGQYYYLESCVRVCARVCALKPIQCCL